MPNWLVFMRFLLPWILNLIFGQKNVTLRVPLCGQHQNRLKLGTYIAYGLVGVLFVGIFASIGLNAAGNANAGGAVALGCVVILLPTLIALLVIQITTPRLEELDHRVVTLTAVSPKFLAAVQPAGAPASRTPQRQVTSHAKGASSRGAGTKSTSPAMVIVLSIGAVALVSMLLCGGLVVMMRARSNADNPGPVADRPGMDFHNENIAKANAMHEEAMRRHEEARQRFDERVREQREAFQAARNEAKRDTNRNRSAPNVGGNDAVASTQGNAAETRASNRSSSFDKFPADSIEVDVDTKLDVGDEVWARFGLDWSRATITSVVSRTAVKVRKLNDPSSRAMLRPRSLIRLPGAAPQPESAIANTSPPEPEIKPLRIWTDSTGKHKTEARMISKGDGDVTLERVDGKVVTIPLSRLSQEDQDFVASSQ